MSRICPCLRIIFRFSGRKRRNSDENLDDETTHLLSDEEGDEENGLLDDVNQKVSMLTEEQIKSLVDNQV